jgi:hypothetical protein
VARFHGGRRVGNLRSHPLPESQGIWELINFWNWQMGMKELPPVAASQMSPSRFRGHANVELLWLGGPSANSFIHLKVDARWPCPAAPGAVFSHDGRGKTTFNQLSKESIFLRHAHKSGPLLRGICRSTQKSSFNHVRRARWPLSFALKSIQ